VDKENKYFDLVQLRSFAGRKEAGKKEELRTARRISFTKEVWEELETMVETGRGGYGTAVCELGLRLMIALAKNETDKIEKIGEELVEILPHEQLSEAATLLDLHIKNIRLKQ